ncbi:hypothetical protein Tco_1130070, partial [Tanacetum coccineum]
MALPPRDQRHQYLRYEGLQCTDANITDFEMMLARIYRREVHRVQVFDFGGLPDLMAEGLSTRMLMEHRDAQGLIVFTSRAWRRLFDIRGPLIGIPSAGDFHGTAPSYTSITNPILRLCHRLIACSITGRSQAPEKVTVIDLFYLRGMDVGSVNIPYLLAMYLRLFASGRKQGAMISGWQFVARLAEHFGLLMEERIQGLTPWDQRGTPPPAAARTMPQRMAKLEEDVHEIHGALAEQREVIGAMARDFSRLTVWAARPRERNINKYWWRIYKSGDLGGVGVLKLQG